MTSNAKHRLDDTAPFQEEDPRVLAIARQYLAALEAGEKPDRSKCLTQYPELAEVLAECLDGVELAHSLTPPQTAERPPASALAAEPLGDFRIVREIGRGGMGAVYEAVQLSLGRRVALKVLPFAAAMDERQKQRFQLEAQAAAQLHHSNIVPIYAVGCERGTHFYAMQLINGDTIATLIEQLRADRSQAANSETATDSHVLLPPAASTMVAANTSRARTSLGAGRSRFAAAARLIAQIADALEYAHSAGIVHRDVKPANILVDASGNGWITDFGLAQIAANSAMTQTGDLIGTLRYMSPEQATGRRTSIDHRTDIYSLGATLYELLCLRPIFSGDDRQSLLHSILNSEPAMLRSVDRSIPIELETIVHKALAKSSADRYLSAGEFAADLRRFIEERPIKARRPTLIDHARKWGRRHPAVVGMTLLGLVLGVIGLSIGMAAIAREQSKTRAALAREEVRAKEAEARLRIAQQAADDMISLAEFDLSDNPFEEGLRKRLLESALSHYQSFVAEEAENPTARAALAQTRDRVQKILADLVLLSSLRQSFLLREPDVLVDLQTTPEQAQAIEIWLLESSRNFEAAVRLRERGAEEFHAKMVEAAHLAGLALHEILSDAQADRLKQLALQSQGLKAFHESEVISELQLTTDQRAQIRLIESQLRFRETMRNDDGQPRRGSQQPAPPGDGGPAFGRNRPPFRGDRPPRFPRDEELAFSESGRTAMQDVLAKLTTQQQRAWTRLVGAPFEGSLYSFPVPPPEHAGRQRGPGLNGERPKDWDEYDRDHP